MIHCMPDQDQPHSPLDRMECAGLGRAILLFALGWKSHSRDPVTKTHAREGHLHDKCIAKLESLQVAGCFLGSSSLGTHLIPALLISKSADRVHRSPRSKLAVQLSPGIGLAFASAFAHSPSPGLALVPLALQPHSQKPLCCKATPLLRSLTDNPIPSPVRGRIRALTYYTLHVCLIDPVDLLYTACVPYRPSNSCYTTESSRLRQGPVQNMCKL